MAQYRTRRAPLDGVLLIDKPAGCTSHDVVARCRRIFGQRRVGHAGTLDPDAIVTPGVYVQRILQGARYEKRIERRTVRSA